MEALDNEPRTLVGSQSEMSGMETFAGFPGLTQPDKGLERRRLRSEHERLLLRGRRNRHDIGANKFVDPFDLGPR